MPPFQVDRRTLLGAGALGFAVPLTSAAAQFRADGVFWSPNTSSYPTAVDLKAHYLFFTVDEAAFVEAAALRLIPADPTGPRALEAGVPLFLDRQLAGDYGKDDLGGDVDGKAYFKLLLQNVMEGYFSDPIYGGIRNLSAWMMSGFSGARYDQRPYVLAYNRPYPLPPVGIGGRPAWTARG